MSKYELTIAPDYVPDWGITEAFRELFQNALDQETIDPDNYMFFEYDEENQQVSIGNRNSCLEIKSLLFGTSTKSNNADTIGKFGEGYKLASLVLTREGKKITFYNYHNKEVWRPRFVASRRYGTDILTFFTEKHTWKKVPHRSLEIVIEGITKEEYEQIETSNLHIVDSEDYIEVKEGRILYDRPGQIYVNGLYVEYRDEFKCGYDIKPRYLVLDRDRKSVKDFDFKYLIAHMHVQASDTNIDKTMNLVKDNASDVVYMHYRTTYQATPLKTSYREKFVQEYGKKAVPVINSYKQEEVLKTYEDAKPIFVTETEANLLGDINVDNLTPKEDVEKSTVEKLDDWFSALCDTHDIEDKFIDEFDQLINELKE